MESNIERARMKRSVMLNQIVELIGVEIEDSREIVVFFPKAFFFG